MSLEIPSSNPVETAAGSSAGDFNEDDDFDDFEGLEGIEDFQAFLSASPRELFEPEHHTAPPEEILPLPLEPEVTELLAHPVVTKKGINCAREALCGNIGSLIDEGRCGLRITRQEFDGAAEVAISEAFQNALRHGGGANRVKVGLTPSGGIFIEVENMSMDFPENCLRAREGQRPLRLGTYRTVEERTSGPDKLDGHGMGLSIISAVSSAMGVYSTETLPVRLQDSDRIVDHIRRCGVWAVFGGGVEVDESLPENGSVDDGDEVGNRSIKVAA